MVKLDEKSKNGAIMRSRRMQKGGQMKITERFPLLTPVEAGWSGDKKFFAAGADGKKYFLRIAPAKKAEKARGAFELQKRLHALGVPMCIPLECGECEEGFYTLQS